MDSPFHRRDRVDTPQPTDSEALHLHLERFRRRSRTVLLARHLCMAAPAALVLADASVRWPTLGPHGWVTAVGLLALVAALTHWKTPDRAGVAALVDRRFRLEDRAVAALTVSGSRDAVAELIVRDAILRIKDLPADRVIPLELGHSARAALIAAALLVVPLVLTSPSFVVPRGGDDEPSVEIAAGQRQSRLSGRGTAGESPQSSPASGDADSTLAREERPSPGRAEASPSRPGPEGSGTVATSRLRDAAPQALSPSAFQAESARSSTDTGAAASGTRSVASPSGAPPAATGSGPRSPGVAAAGAAPQAARSGTGAEASASDAREGAGTAGGMLRSAPPLASPPPTILTPSGPAYVARYREARAVADVAIAREQVPRSRRSHVRDYFLAIRPAD
jgi:hypothetical protein